MNGMPSTAVARTYAPLGMSIPGIGGKIPALLGFVSVLVGIAVGLGQVSSSAKARRTIEWINGAVDGNTGNELRLRILKERRSSQEARLVAALHVPWWKFAWFPSWAIGGGVLVVYCEFHREVLKDNWVFQILYFFFCLCLSWQTVGWRAERAWVSRQYEADHFTEPPILSRSTDALRFVIALLHSLCPALLCIVLVLSIRGNYTALVSTLITLLTLACISLPLTAWWLEKKFAFRWPQYFAREYANKWNIATENTADDKTTKEVASTQST
ncbi:hypothetical protein [uncultured Cardiobacterium sp.]|uniref:hypothetical protein n=1 Tax=uncultured Cardiobacterium sp. TaxID=417619 RepID=UPI0026367E68|nr:hypothetical protein [uncultured Cardiobacterium sp.]